MLYNAKRELVTDWRGGESRCPNCRGELLAVDQQVLFPHWQHRCQGDRNHYCPRDNTPWHLAMKNAYLGLPDWQVECPMERYGKTLWVDAVNWRLQKAREFVSALSKYTEIKRYELGELSGWHTFWVLDGAALVRARALPCKGGGLHKFLPPDVAAAYNVNAVTHYQGDLWREWKNNVWYRCTDHWLDTAISELEADTIIAAGRDVELPYGA